MRSHRLAAASAAFFCASLAAGGAVAQQTSAPTLPMQQGAEPTNPGAPAGAPGNPSAQGAAAAAAGSDQPWKPPATFGEWASGIKLSFQGDAGIAGNPADPNNGINFGQLFTDKANRPILNQAVFAVGRALDPKATDYDVGFRFALLYGSDARIIHTLGIFDRVIHDRNQIDVEEADLLAHTPWLFEGGIDFKGGIFPTPLGAETIDPKPNPFYTHSYIFNYGLPFKHLGLLSTAHVTSLLDVYLGIDSGTNTSVGTGDNNSEPAGIVGFGLNFAGGNFTILALSHMGPENPTRSTPFGNSAMRYYNDLVWVWKANPKLTITGEGNFVRDDGFQANGIGYAQYVAYVLNDSVTLNGRAEIFRDDKNFYVSTPVNNLDVVNALAGFPSNFYTSQRPTTYTEFTVGATWTPQGLPKAISTLAIRPEFRYDRAIAGGTPFNDGRSHDQVLLSADVILGF
jgi:hypothetical protein